MSDEYNLFGEWKPAKTNWKFQQRQEELNNYRIWTPAEVPIGSIVRHWAHPELMRAMIVGCNPNGIRIDSGWKPYQFILQTREYLTDDGQWEYCGVRL